MDSSRHYFYATIKKVESDSVTVDLNHPYAGKDLTFDGEITTLRDAAPEEIQEILDEMNHECGCGDSI